ncbi:MAG: Gfo/Idh/MocA family oxidoreductase [bacterium]|nr:Gfo/Idh/MocA family oxidoreductase [bacterium]
MVLRVGVIGLGVGRSHVMGYRANLNSKITALCDTNVVRLKEIADEFGIPEEACYTDYTAMLNEARLDMVSVCLPNALHADVSIIALDSGAHVLCEKPMATTISEAERMLEAAARNQRRLMVTYNWRYRADSQWLYKVVQSGTLGEIYHVNVSWRRETGIPGWGLFGSKTMSGGGALIDLGVHVLDLGLWLLGFPEVKTVSGQARTVFGDKGRKTWARKPGQVIEGGFDVDDGAIGFLRLGNGANMLLQSTWAEHTQPHEDRIRVEVQGSEGTAVLSIGNYKKEDSLRLYTEIEGEPVTIIPGIRWNTDTPHTALIGDLLDAITSDRPSPTDGQQGYVAVRVLEAMYASSAEGREIAF